MTFIITGAYIAALFGLGVWFIRRGDRTPRQDADARIPREGIKHERRTGKDRRRQPAALSHTL